ncbi:MAG: hypothetical protein ABFS08_10595 [Pseudomonadota bacterium]
MNDEQLMLLEQLGISQADFERMQTLAGVLLVVTVVSFVLTLWLARRKKLNMGFWTFMVLLMGPFALMAILFVPAKESTSEPQA